MSDVVFILLSAFFFGHPRRDKIHYCFSDARHGESAAQSGALSAYAFATAGGRAERKIGCAPSAFTQMHAQRRQANARRQMQEEQLHHVRSLAESVAQRRRRPLVEKPTVSTLEMPQLEEVIDVDESVETAAIATAAKTGEGLIELLPLVGGELGQKLLDRSGIRKVKPGPL